MQPSVFGCIIPSGAVNTHRPWQINGNDKSKLFPFIIHPLHRKPTMKWLFHFLKRRGGLSCDSSGELQWLASASACLQGNPDVPFQINLDSSAFINRAHSGGFIPSCEGRKKDTGQNVSLLKTALHCVPLEITRRLFNCSCNYNLFEWGCLMMMVKMLV